MTKKVEETGQYENCMDLLQNEPAKEITLADFFEIKDGEKIRDEWEDHWHGMPTYKNDEKKHYKTVYVHFETKNDMDEFAKRIGQNMTDKTKYIWFPKKEGSEITLLRWVDEEGI
jgi:hypothetical protein